MSDSQDKTHFDLWIEAGRSEHHYWRDLWRYRELFYILAWRDIAVRYKQTVAGVLWALFQPLINMAIMTAVFSVIAGLPSVNGAPYAIMVFAAMLPWQFFANAVSNASQSIVGNANMISKVYFPRIIVPCSTLGVSLIDLVVALVLLGGLMVVFQFAPTWRLLTLPAFIALVALAAMGPSMLITALSVRYRDFRIIVPFLVQFGMYLSPVAYSSEIIRQKLEHLFPGTTGQIFFALYALNPLVGIIEGFRWAILGGNSPALAPYVGLSLLVSALSAVAGLAYFRRTEKWFADVI